MLDRIADKKEIGRRIRFLRAASSLSQMELAEKIGVSFQQVQKYEAGKTELSVSRLLSIASALRVSLEDIVGIKNSSVADRGIAEAVSQERMEKEKLNIIVYSDEVRLLTFFRRIRHPRVRNQVIELVKHVADIVQKK